MLKRYKIEDICILEKGEQIDTSLLNDKNNYKYINGGITQSGYYDNYNTNENTVIVSEGGASCGFVNYISEKFWCGCHCYRLTKATISPKYLYYALKANQNDIMLLRSGSAMPNIKKSTFNKMEIKLDKNKENQDKVVSLLDKLISLISKRKEQLAKLDELAKSRFLEMFGDPNTNPFSYKVCRLNEITETKLSYGSGASSKNFDGELRYIRITDILESGDLSDDKKSPTNFDEKYLLNDGDILFARSGATVGKTYCYKSKYGKSIYAGYLIRLVPNKKIVYPEYIYAFTKTKYYESLIQSIQRAVAQPNINAKEYGEFKIILPPLEKQAEYILFLQQLDKSKFRIKKSLEKLELTYKALLQEYFG